MPTHIDTGKMGEQLAASYLVKNGYSILERNWRNSHYEMDIIAEKNNMLHFVEVKCRSSGDFCQPELSVNKTKIQHLLKAVTSYLRLHPAHKDFRLDVLSIIARPGRDPEYFLIEDVYL